MYLMAMTLAMFLAVVFLGVHALIQWNKSRIETGVQIQCSSGDSEVMSFNYNFLKGESEESKASKLHEAFQKIQDRRDENHAKYLEIRARAIAENEEKAKSGEELKLRSITEGKEGA